MEIQCREAVMKLLLQDGAAPLIRDNHHATTELFDEKNNCSLLAYYGGCYVC
jgi:hypothetical protein